MSVSLTILVLTFDVRDYTKGGLGLDPGHFATLRERLSYSRVNVFHLNKKPQLASCVVLRLSTNSTCIREYNI